MQKYDPRANCGPKKLFIWPAKPKILLFSFLSHNTSFYVLKNTM